MNEHSDPGHDFDFELDQVLHALMETVPEAHRPRYAEIGELIDVFCDEHLQPLALDYQLCCRALAAACCQKSSPVVTRRVSGETWAAAIVPSGDRTATISCT